VLQRIKLRKVHRKVKKVRITRGLVERRKTEKGGREFGKGGFSKILFTIAKLWKQPRCPTLTNGLRKCGIYTQWNFMQP
jgi:hypothetical protein